MFLLLIKTMSDYYPDIEMGCQKCGQCCAKSDVLILLDRMAQETIDKSLQDNWKGFPVMKSDENGCAALDYENCSIYDIRPFYCRTYPLDIREIDGRLTIISQTCEQLSCRLKDSEKDILKKIADFRKKDPEYFSNLKQLRYILSTDGVNTLF